MTHIVVLLFGSEVPVILTVSPRLYLTAEAEISIKLPDFIVRFFVVLSCLFLKITYFSPTMLFWSITSSKIHSPFALAVTTRTFSKTPSLLWNARIIALCGYAVPEIVNNSPSLTLAGIILTSNFSVFKNLFFNSSIVILVL